MSGNNNTAWSSKFKKFGITNPFLKLITVKYEKSIPWQTVVKDEATLNIYLRDILIPELKKKTKRINSFRWERFPKSMFICPNDLIKLDLEKILKSPSFTDDEISNVSVYINDIGRYYEFVKSGLVNEDFESFQEGCIEGAVIELSPILNRLKEESFKIWFEVIERDYEKNYGFQYLILKPIIEKSGYNSIKLLQPPDNDLLKWIFIRIQYEFYNASINFRNEYNIRFQNFEVSDWPYITSKTANPSKFIAEASKNDWCFEIKIKDHVPYSLNESLELTILRALECIILNDSSDFTDIIFVEEILVHPQFKKIRKEAWLKAVLMKPTLYFEFPPDLEE